MTDTKKIAEEHLSQNEDGPISRVLIEYLAIKNAEAKTDLDRFVELYQSFGVDCALKVQEDGTKELELIGNFYITPDSKRTNSTVAFNREGKFLSQGFWEE